MLFVPDVFGIQALSSAKYRQNFTLKMLNFASMLDMLLLNWCRFIPERQSRNYFNVLLFNLLGDKDLNYFTDFFSFERVTSSTNRFISSGSVVVTFSSFAVDKLFSNG